MKHTIKSILLQEQHWPQELLSSEMNGLLYRLADATTRNSTTALPHPLCTEEYHLL